MTHRGVASSLIALIVLSVPALAKTGSTIYTPARVANARHNIQRCAWAKKMKDSAVKEAEHFLAQSDDWLWNLPTPQSIPRGTQVSMKYGCPKCGRAIERFGGRPWKISVLARPWKIKCPNCGEIFPKNDFAKFYASGKDANGVFHYEKANRALLFNAEHPDPKDPLHTYGVDDSRGWDDGKGHVYRFIGFYGHYGAWSETRSALTALKDAYVYTGDVKYARKAALLLYRIAEFYPDMDYGFWEKLGFNNSDGGTGRGKIYGCIWETGLVDSFMTAYDAIYPALKDAQILAELSKMTRKKITASDLRKFVEKNIVREAHDGILSRKINGNEGMYQKTMATAAIVLDEPGTSEKWLDWIFADGDLRHGDVSGGNMVRIFTQKVDADGMGDEASPSYNAIWRNTFQAISDMLDLYPKYKKHRLVDNPRYRKMFEAPVRLTCAGNFSPTIGDFKMTGNPGLASIQADDLVYAFREFKDPEFAQMAYFVNGNTVKGLRGDIFDSEPETVAKQIEAVIKARGPYVFKTDNLPSYGCAILRSGGATAPASGSDAVASRTGGDNARALSLYYGRNLGHGHKDTLNIELFAQGLDLMPDMGYPEHATDWPSRYEWSSATISHNTVVVDQKKQKDSLIGTPHFVVEGKGVSAAEVSADKPYPQTSLYQRTTALIDVSDKDSYVVDIFRVKGGAEQMMSIHGPEGDVETEGLNLVDQPKGTLAGENIEPFADLGLDKNYGVNATGYQYLYDIRRDAHPSILSPPNRQPAITYNVVDTWHVLSQPKDVRLRINLLSPPGEVILAHGDPPQNKPGNPRRLQYILLPHRAAQSTFVNVIEPYAGARTISKIERKDDGDTVTITVTTASGRVDTIISALKPIKTRIAGLDISGRFAVVSEENGKAEAKLTVTGGTQ